MTAVNRSIAISKRAVAADGDRVACGVAICCTVIAAVDGHIIICPRVKGGPLNFDHVACHVFSVSHPRHAARDRDPERRGRNCRGECAADGHRIGIHAPPASRGFPAAANCNAISFIFYGTAFGNIDMVLRHIRPIHPITAVNFRHRCRPAKKIDMIPRHAVVPIRPSACNGANGYIRSRSIDIDGFSTDRSVRAVAAVKLYTTKGGGGGIECARDIQDIGACWKKY